MPPPAPSCALGRGEYDDFDDAQLRDAFSRFGARSGFQKARRQPRASSGHPAGAPNR